MVTMMNITVIMMMVRIVGICTMQIIIDTIDMIKGDMLSMIIIGMIPRMIE